jgi:hypothetical protein
MNPDTTPTPRTDTAIWRLTKFDSALLEHEGETLNEIRCASHDEAECLVDLLNEKERELAASEDEVERLQANLARAVEIAEHYQHDIHALCIGDEETQERVALTLDQIKATLNQDDK